MSNSGADSGAWIAPTTCSIARALEVVGDRWTLLILREAVLFDVTRFADFRDRLGIAPTFSATV
jgi:DNA-binding HxlR family transcriptional regulator